MADDVVIHMTGKEARLWRSIEKVIQQEVRLEQSFRKAGQSASEAGRRGEEASRRATRGWKTDMLKRFISTLSGVAGGLSVVSAFRAVVNLAREAQQEIKEVAGALEETYGGMKRIWQVSESQEVYRGLTTTYKLAMAREGMTKQESQDLAFTAKSFQELESLPAAVKAQRFMQADTAMQFLARIRAPTAWGKGIATPEQALAGLAMGAFKSGFDIDVTAEWFARVASPMKQMGATPWEVLGVGAAISPAITEGTMHATTMRRLEATLSKWRAEAIAEGKIRPEQAQGFIGTFQAMRELDPEGYAAALRENVRFKVGAAALEGAIPEARALAAEIQQQFRTGAMYYEKTRTPPDLSLMQQRNIARMQKELALEPLGMKQLQLETRIDQAKALAAAGRGSLVVEKGWEKLLEAGATIGEVDAAKRLATERVLEHIANRFPTVWREHLTRHFRTEGGGVQYTYGLGGIRGRQAPRGVIMPARVSAEQELAIQKAMERIMAGMLENFERAAKHRSEAARVGRILSGDVHDERPRPEVKIDEGGLRRPTTPAGHRLAPIPTELSDVPWGSAKEITERQKRTADQQAETVDRQAEAAEKMGEAAETMKQAAERLSSLRGLAPIPSTLGSPHEDR